MKTNKVTNLDIGAATHTVTIMKKSSFNVSKPTRRRSKESIASSGHWGPTKAQKGDWISHTFFKRECFKFIEKASKPGFCHCGLPRDGHMLKGTVINTDPSATWISEQCTRRIPTDTFGEMEFAEDPSSRKPYIRVSHDSEALSLLKLLTTRWGLKVPNLVISVTGGAKSFQMGQRLKEAFSKGLIKVAVSTDAWIITGGTSTGVMQHVGEAVASRTQIGMKSGKINCIGIAPWGQVDNSKYLISRNGRGCYPAHYTIEVSDKGKAPLDINHSHFILVDNGTVGQYGVEIGLRSSVEGAILQHLKTTSQSSAGAIGIPVVILCLEGGPNTIKTMAEAIKKGVPAVVIDGTGRAADVVAFAYKHTIEVNQVSVIDPEYVNDVKIKVADVFGKQSEEAVYTQIEELLREKRMVSVYRLDDEKGSQDIDLAILKALLKVNQNFSSQLKLSLAWNRIDVAKSEIFTEKHKKKIKPEDLSGCMFTALIDDKPDFVSLFLNEGVQLKKFLTVDILCYLYAKLPHNSPVVQLILEKNDKSRLISMWTIALVVEELMGDKFKSRYRDADYEGSKKISLDSTFEPDPDAKKCAEPVLDLFIWAVLANRRELASLIWERSRENIAAALMASKLLKGLVDKVLSERDMVDIGSSLLDHASDWEQTAIGVLDECRKQDDNLAQRLVVKELSMFSHLTSLDIAVSAEDQDFIAHPTCQALLNKLWLGTMSELTTHTWQVAVGFFAPVIIPFMVSFSGDEDQKYFVINERPQTALETHDNIGAEPDTDMLMITEKNEDIMNIGSTRSFKDFDGRESVELHEYVPEDKNPIHQLVNIDDPNDAVDATLRSARLSYIEKILRFYQAPFVKFFANVVSYLIFLALYAYMILSQFNMRPHLSEFVLQAWVFTLIVEEIRQLITQEPNSFIRKLEWYFASTWNIADFFSLCAFLTAVVLRYVAWHDNNKNYLNAAQIILATDVIIFIVRLLQIFSVNKNLGPKLVMIRKMLHDLKYFIFILAIFIIGYGVAFQAVRFPNTHFGKAVVGVINKPYWQMYGELFIEEILEDQKNCTNGQPLCGQPGEEPCSSSYGKYIAPIYMALYMLFTNILLLNLLIAIFNYTFEKVQDDSDKVWKFQRYDLILEYHDRPALSPPLIIISHCFLGMKWIVQRLRCCGCRPLQGSSMKFQLSPEENEQLRMWEFAATESFILNSKLVESETLDERVKYIQSRVESVSDDITEAMNNPSFGTVTCPDTPRARRMTQTRAAPALEGRIARLEYKMQQIYELLIQQSQKQAALLEAGKALSGAPGANQTMKKITTIHMKARTSPYPNSTVMRATVPDSCVPWETPFPEYMPVVYTAAVVLAQPVWADPDLLSMDPRPLLPFNSYDEAVKNNRKSHTGEYPVIDKLPRNPMGRTGIVGRGLLGKWGPNHAVDPIATRWKRTNSGLLLDKGKRVLEFIAIQRKDNHQWAIPGGMIDNNERISQTLRREFSEEALAKLDLPPERRRIVSEKIEELFKHGTEVYKGYVDDPRNTDNAWMETIAYNFHDDTGEVFGDLELKAGDDAEAVRWQRVSGNIPLFASHVGILEKVASMHDAAFY